ncbi:MAG TPA: hypothetical protein VMZ22_03775 [Acidimicrobiales bacterium]|nr:hypothetical protein [Acidimicrobiales bacterium]
MARTKRRNIDAVVREFASISVDGNASHLERAAVALRLAAEADTYARSEVMAGRELDGASWADVGAELGMSRQAAHERFRMGPDGFHSRWYKQRSTK